MLVNIFGQVEDHVVQDTQVLTVLNSSIEFCLGDYRIVSLAAWEWILSHNHHLEVKLKCTNDKSGCKEISDPKEFELTDLPDFLGILFHAGPESAS